MLAHSHVIVLISPTAGVGVLVRSSIFVLVDDWSVGALVANTVSTSSITPCSIIRSHVSPVSLSLQTRPPCCPLVLDTSNTLVCLITGACQQLYVILSSASPTLPDKECTQ